MKKLLSGLAILIILAIAGLYFFMPRQFNVSRVAIVNAPSPAIYRFLSEEAKWKQWLPEATPIKNGFTYNGDSYEITPGYNNIVGITIRHKDSVVHGTISIVTINADSNAVQWQCKVYAGANPFQRLMQYAEAGKMKQNMIAVLGHLQAYLSKKANIYGAPVDIVSIKDTLLITTQTTMNTYPTTASVYGLVKNLQSFIAGKGAVVTGYPLLNISSTDSSHYQIMVALPTNHELKSEGNFAFRRMIPGNFLMMEVKGGQRTTKEAVAQLQLYLSDHQKTLMAIPFEMLVTDRTAEPDTAKWITRVYQPVYR